MFIKGSLTAKISDIYILLHVKSATESHFRETEALIRDVPAPDIVDWLLNYGYFPEENILPPCFRVSGFELQTKPYHQDLADLPRRQLASVSHPKGLLTFRSFGTQHPKNYHDAVFHLMDDWSNVIDHLFHPEQKIFSYSFPIPVSKRGSQNLSSLRTGRMIYEWIEMAEKDLIIDAHKYKIIARTDITNFYPSVYTHSIAWALHSREDALSDKSNNLVGNKIDRLFQYANDGRTNGIPVGSGLCDLIAEIILADIDLRVSKRTAGRDYIAVRFKDDYRILAQDQETAKDILEILSSELQAFNLTLNEGKTVFLNLPDGLYRRHDRDYFPHSLKRAQQIPFKEFEHTLLIALEIHRKYPGTSILEKFIAELFDGKRTLKITYSKKPNPRNKEVRKTVSLLFLLKRESTKILCHVLSVIEAVYLIEKKSDPYLKEFLKKTVEDELRQASNRSSVFEAVWLIFFARYISLGIESFNDLVEEESMRDNLFYKSIITSQQKFFTDSGISLFKKPKDCRRESLAQKLAIFER